MVKSFSLNVLPNGGVYSSYSMCGRPNCRCAKNKDNRHLKHDYIFREGNKLKKIYLKKEYVADVHLIVDRMRRAKKMISVCNSLIAELKREANKKIKGGAVIYD